MFEAEGMYRGGKRKIGGSTVIVDKIGLLGTYAFKGCQVVEKFLLEHAPETITEKRYELSNGIFVMVQEGVPRENYCFEAHRRYIDVQVVLAGNEKIFWASLQDGNCTVEYDEKCDAAFYQVAEECATDIHLFDGMFAVFGPQDLHAPLNPLGANTFLKLVFKIPLKE
ncbi:MAG: YhcH/YjgK/YiaL family protein [Clostridia bacterium]|nr:YhcH/YjgK/YiaL family protein [Clostridia bacterium]